MGKRTRLPVALLVIATGEGNIQSEPQASHLRGRPRGLKPAARFPSCGSGSDQTRSFASGALIAADPATPDPAKTSPEGIASKGF